MFLYFYYILEALVRPENLETFLTHSFQMHPFSTP